MLLYMTRWAHAYVFNGVQDYGKLGVVSTEDKQKLYRLVKQLSGKGGARAAAGPSPR